IVDSGDCSEEINEKVYEKMRVSPHLSQFLNQMLWTFQAETPCELFDKLRQYTMSGSIERIESEMLVANSSQDQIAGSYEQSIQFYNDLPGPKTYLLFTDVQGAQFHCQSGAPLVSSEGLLNWLDERAKP
ncbi:MAG: hypothetical protein ACOCWR_10870, partial [Oceanidesulfovibrio sp.]